MPTTDTTTPNAAAAGQVHLGDLTVNRLGYGAMRITGQGIWGPPKDHDAAIKTLRRAVELGVNFIDTADSYGPNVSEELIAEALSPYPKGLVIATKGGWERVGPAQWIHNASPKHLEEAVEGSLKRLKLDRIDVYQLHIPDPAVSFDASMETLEKLRQNGKIRHLAAHDLLDKFAKELEATPLQVALAWLLRRSPVTLPIPGTSSPQHLEENIAAASLKLPDPIYKQLEAVTPPPASLR
jgi:pyridoxine 4-dehydrogenase